MPSLAIMASPLSGQHHRHPLNWPLVVGRFERLFGSNSIQIECLSLSKQSNEHDIRIGVSALKLLRHLFSLTYLGLRNFCRKSDLLIQNRLFT